MNELEMQQVIRIALDAASRHPQVAQAEPPPARPAWKSMRALLLATCTAAAGAALMAACSVPP